MESNNHETDTQMQVDEQSTTLNLGFEENFDVQYADVSIIPLEESIEEPNEFPIYMEMPIEPNEEPSSKPKVGTREYMEFIFDKSGIVEKCFDPYIKYFEKPPLEPNWFEHMPYYEDWAHRFDKLKRVLNGMLFKFNLSSCYLCFCEMSSQEFDRLLRALTMSNLVKSC